MLKKYKIIRSFLVLIGLFFLFSINLSFGYLDHLNEYKGLKSNIIDYPNQIYYNYKEDELYKNSAEYRELQGLVKVDNIFDAASKELEKKVLTRKNDLINGLKNNTFETTGQKEIDDEIEKIEKEGKYLIAKFPGQLITISSTNYIYIHNHKLLGNVDVVGQIQKLFDEHRNQDNVINTPNSFKNELIEILNNYDINFEEIEKNFLSGKLHIGKINETKKVRNVNLFISNSFSTPFLEENFENENNESYVWTYLPNDDLLYSYDLANEDLNQSEIYMEIDIFEDIVYLGMVGNNSDILSNFLLGGNLDLYIYKVQKNSYEYYIFLIVIIIGAILGVFLTNNFITNYKSNFKRIPEEL